MPRNNRRAGHTYELEVAELLRESSLFPHVVTSRSENRARDGEGVDLVNKDEAVHGRMDYNIQCKYSVERPDYHKLICSMPQLDGVINVVLHKYARKSGSRFMTQGEYALMRKDDFLRLLRIHRGFEVLYASLDLLPDEERTALERLLENLGL